MPARGRWVVPPPAGEVASVQQLIESLASILPTPAELADEDHRAVVTSHAALATRVASHPDLQRRCSRRSGPTQNCLAGTRPSNTVVDSDLRPRIPVSSSPIGTKALFFGCVK